MEKSKKDTIVLYPAPLIGHIVSMVELTKLIILHHGHRFSIIVILTTGLFENDEITSYVDRISQTIPYITFHRFLPLPNPPSLETFPTRHPVYIIYEFIRLNKQNLLNTLQTISFYSYIPAIVIDFFCNDAFDVAAYLNIPLYYYCSSGAAALAALLYVPTIHEQTDKSFRDLGNTDLHIPGLPKILGSQMLDSLLDRNNGVYYELLQLTINIPKSRGVITNTFKALEARAINAIANGDCTPRVVPPVVFYIGPLISEPRARSGGSDCLSWLDGQPSRSVVFLCFGNGSHFSEKQITEIAVGLERSGQRFLWVVRNPPENWDVSRAFEEFDLEPLMPEGFLGRTRDRGLVVKAWAPQWAVLSRESVGGFVTHCGWNSVLEAVCAGLPMVAWPLYAEQHINMKVLVEEMKMAMPMEASDEDGFVVAEEVEKRVKALMESEEVREIRKRCLEMREKALAAWAEDDGSGRTAFSDLAESWTT